MNLGSWGKGISCYRSQIYFSDCVIYCRSHIGYPSRIFFSGFVAMQDFFFLKFCFAGFFFLFLDSPPLHISNGASLKPFGSALSRLHILADLLGNRSLLQQVQKVMNCDWWTSIRFVCFCALRFVAFDLQSSVACF